MRAKLYYKFFGIVFLSIILSLITAAVTFGYFGRMNFEKYLEKTRMQEFAQMADNIGFYYKTKGGFDELVKFDLPLHIAFESRKIKVQENDKDFLEMEAHRPRPSKRIFTLFDMDMKRIIGGNNPPEDMHIFPVKSDGVQVGNFGVLKREKMPNPFADMFLKKQASMLVVTSLIVMMVASLTALWLARNMLAPLNMLSNATRRVSERDFDVEIDVESGDEISDLAANFKIMIETLKEYEQKQSRWISDISHELRTPLSVLLGSLEAIQDGIRKPDAETLDAIYKNAVRMKRMVNELHDISLAEAGTMHLHKVKVDIVQELGSLLDFYSVRFSEYNFRVDFEHPETGYYVSADRMRINQVFINILENTIKYAKSPGVLYVDCAKENGDIVVSFEDTGPGVASEHLPFIFDRLYRVDTSRSRATGGSGLGLSICKYIIEHHEGSISALRGQKGGLRMEIRLPLESEDE